MSPRHFSIDLGPSGLIEDDPLTFDFKGVLNGEPWTEVFECLPKIPAGATAALGGWSFPVSLSVEFIAGCLTRESEDRFRALILDKERIVDGADLAQVVQNILMEYTGRPPKPPVVSPNGAATTGTTSTGG